MPGLVPTKMAMRFDSIMSVSGRRCSYFEGGAYFDNLRFLVDEAEGESFGRLAVLFFNCG